MKKEKGITLIALVVTIVVLIILAGVSISMLAGENGIINQANNAKENTEQARVEELVDLAVNSLIGENQGSTNGITPKMIANEVNEMENRSDVYAENTILFPSKIIFPEEGRKVDVNLDSIEVPDDIYSEPGAEEQIASTDLFNIEKIDETAKTAKIARIKSEYCNIKGYNPKTNKNDLTDTNYKINYPGITDTLVIPYQAEIDGEIYTITEVDLTIPETYYGGGRSFANFPSIETIIYPNTVTKVYSTTFSLDVSGINGNSQLKKIVLSEKLEKIPQGFFQRKYDINWKIQSITIPASVTIIESNAFRNWTSEQIINVPYKSTEEFPDGWVSNWNGNATIKFLEE